MASAKPYRREPERQDARRAVTGEYRLYSDVEGVEYEFNENRICVGCPVFAKTGKVRCEGSPYDIWMDGESVADAKKELKFLKSLLPRGRRNV